MQSRGGYGAIPSKKSENRYTCQWGAWYADLAIHCAFTREEGL